MTLLVTYGPHGNGSGVGYYRQLAEDNFLSWRDLPALAGLQRTRRELFVHPEIIAQQLGLEKAWTEDASQKESECQSWGRLHRAKTDPVCPDCLQENCYIRHFWQHAYVTACSYHRTRLIDVCNQCDKPLSQHRYHIGTCDCGQPLTMLPRIPATSSQLWLSTLITSRGEDANGIAPAIEGVDVSALIKVVHALCTFADPAKPVSRRDGMKSKLVADAIDFLKPLEDLLPDWPKGFHFHVEKRISAGRANARTLNSLLGPWYVMLRKHCLGTPLEPLLTAIIEVAALKFDGALGMDSSKAIAEGVTSYVRAPDAAKAIGVSASRLLKAIQDGECEFRTRRLGTRGQIYEIPCQEVERIQKQRSEWISEETACDLAGVSPSVLLHMMASNVIQSDANWRNDLLKAGPIQSSSIFKLEALIRNAAVVVKATHSEKVTWGGLNSRRLGDKHAIRNTMRAIFDGKITAVVCGDRLGDAEFLRSEVTPYFGTPLLESGFSIQQLSKFTGWKWESISHWIEQGLLESESIQLRGQLCRVVLPPQLLAFRQNYVPMADLARSVGTKSSALSKQLMGIEVFGAQCVGDGATRGALIRIADLCKLAVIGAKAGKDLFVSADAVDIR
ncbi:TniQ family protein [Herbaspirillum seropedicae]|uniref:TniQ family protein n=1 Tax=Herbaspirillum seropedicae TaxID=964 RepID=UPI000847FA40|nr:TniQ family protein [Herbaspirillum seropedicae]AON52335.1 TnsD [Herbaspirillum seropedicae]